MTDLSDIIKFTRSKDFVVLKDIGQGGTGTTKLIKDEILDELFVCKKYHTYYPEHQKIYYQNFVDEIKILYKINHPNIVRVFNYYLYPEQITGYIIMEYIDGVDIEKYIKTNPNEINRIFSQLVEGFTYLQKRKILHRDIRPSNLLVSNDGEVKIIDFGFGKNVSAGDEYNKSITLNWAYSLPSEFSNSLYDNRTEVYFVGKLIEKIINDNSLYGEFKYNSVLSQMTVQNYESRIISFEEVSYAINTVKSKSFNFTDKEKNIYKTFANSFISICSSIKGATKFKENITEITNSLSVLLENSSLETIIQDNSQFIACFIHAPFSYKTKPVINVDVVKQFRDWWVNLSPEKQNVTLNNLWVRFRTLKVEEDDLPF